MVKFNVNGKEYKICFTYGTLGKTDVLDRIVNSNDSNLASVISTTAEAFLYGLQKHHSDELGFDNEEEKEKMLDKVYELFDAYEEESTEDDPKNVYDLYQELQEELMKNGFLSRINQNLQKALEEQKATKVPRDHKKKN